MTKKTIIIGLFILFSNYSFSQFHYFYKGGNSDKSITGFKYKNLHYDASPSGLKKFINETEMDSDLKNSLTNQMKNIKTKKVISDIVYYGGWAAGSGIFINEMLNKKEGEDFKSSTLFTGMGIAGLGMLVNWAIKPKKKHYYEFINTFNRKKAKPIDISFKIDYTKQINYGIALSF